MNTPCLSSRFAYALLFFTVLAVAGALGLVILRHSPANFPTLWPATGVAVAGLLFRGPRYWPVVWAAGTLVSLTSRGLPIAAVMGVGDAATALLVWYLLARAPGFDATLPRRADVIAFVWFGAVVGTLPSPTIGVGIQYLAGLVPAAGVSSYWSTWWVGNLAGVLLVTPPLLFWRSSWFAQLRASGRLVEALAVVAAAGGLAASAVWIRSSLLVLVLHTLVPLPLLLWASLRLGAFPASTVALLAASASIVALVANGPGVQPAGAHQWRMWAYNVMFAGIALLVTALERERAAAAAALRAREAQYRAIVENGLLMFCRFRRDGVLTFVNDTCCRLLGEPREQLLGTNVRTTPHDAFLLASVFGEATSADPRVTTEHHTVAPDGTTRWTRWTYRDVVNAATGDPEIEAVGRDVTTEHETAAEREALALRNWAIVAALGDVVYDWYAEDGRREWDGDVAQVLGHSGQGIGADLDGWVVHVHADDRAGMLAALARATRDNALYDHEYRFRRGDGRWIWIQDRAVTFADQGRLTRMIGVLRDVTERKEAEQALRDSETRLRMAAELSTDLIYEWDIAANRIIASGRVRDMLGVRPSIESTMEGWIELVHPDDRARVRAAIDAHLAHATPFEQQYRVLHPDGVRTWTDRATTIRDAQGHPIRWYGVRTDVTTQVGLEQQLRQSQKMESVGLLAGGVAHDFNNLLQVIQGFTALAQDDALPEPERQGSLRQVTQAADRAAALTRQLLAFGRRQPLQIADADLADLVAQLLKMVRRLIGEHIEVDFTAAAGSLAVRCDRSQIEQVLMNLCLNARDAMPRGGRLTIAVDEWRAHRRDTLLRPGLREGHYARLRVMDVGCGMDETTRRRVFEPFFTTKAEGQGTGLGLAVAYGVVKQHDGYIDVESTPDGGSTFTVLLPLQEPIVTVHVDVSPVRAGTSGHEVILLAEDEAAVRSLGEHVLRRAGYRVLTARDGAEALRVFTAHEDEIALAVLDAVMPRLSGQDVARVIGERRPSIPVLLCSGYPGSPADVALPFLAKPWRPAQLLGQVRQLLDGVAGHLPAESPLSMN